MDKYEVLGLLGEGSFGRVYKAKQTSDSTTVALKVISKRGRSVKEIKGLRRECEIQRHLNHPNIIQMLDSFETDNEIVVITEFAHKELTNILSKEGYLSEEKVQVIVWDLVSALYYLHSHRVLHRDLKPQNILLDSRNKAKLCDFGFARNMSTGTHVLTSIKGTPLYMAPELIEEHPYDHSTDLWSLGCIIYELLVGAPPFCTTSILHLIRMIRHEHIQFPMFISDSGISFLKGLLQKDPSKRLSWPEILKHSFVKGHIIILDDIPSKPLTRPLSIDTLHAKEQQRKSCLTQKAHTKLPSSKSTELTGNQPTDTVKTNSSAKKVCAASNSSLAQTSKQLSNVEEENKNLNEKLASMSIDSNNGTKRKLSCQSRKASADHKNEVIKTLDDIKKCVSSVTTNEGTASSFKNIRKVEDNLNLSEDSSPIENEEWVVFLQRTIEEVMSGEMTSLCQASLANVVVAPLRNSNTSSKVIGYIASLFSLPFVVNGTSDDLLKQIKKVYIDLKLIPNLVYASKLLFKHKRNDFSLTPSSSLKPDGGYRSITDLTEEDLLALERLYLLICHLIHLDVPFLNQFSESIPVFNMHNILRTLLLLSRQRVQIVRDVIAMLTHTLRHDPENIHSISLIILISKKENEAVEDEKIDFIHLLRHSDTLLRERTCYFLQFVGRSSSKVLEAVWSDVMRDTLEALVFDSMENVRNAAEVVVEEFKRFCFYKSSCSNEPREAET